MFSFITGRGSGVRYSGLYAYFVTEKQWVCIQPDLITQPYSYALVPRMAHSMLLDSVSGSALTVRPTLEKHAYALCVSSLSVHGK